MTRAARVPVNAGYGGQQIGQRRVVRWERRENRMLLRNVSYATVADSATAIYQAVRNSNYDLILAAFNVDAYGPDSAAVIDVTRLYTAPPTEIGPGTQFRGNIDPARSFVEKVLSFPTNVEVEAVLTINPPPVPLRLAVAVPSAGRDRHRVGCPALVDGQAPRAADDAASRRQAHRLLHAQHARLRSSRAARPGARLHPPLASGEEGP